MLEPGIRSVANFVVGLSTAEPILAMKPLFVYSLAMVFYGVVIYKYYKFLSKRDIFGLDLRPYKIEDVGFLPSVLSTIVLYILEYIILLPLFTTLWFGVMVVFITFLAKTTTIENVLLISMTVVSATRMAAYYREDLAADMAKLLPFVLLGTFLIDVSYFSLQHSLDLIKSIPLHAKSIVYYTLFAVFLENSLRIGEIISELFEQKNPVTKREIAQIRDIV